ncbi:MAG: acyl-phosphate glycerol 3-phosphate acyltransferase [Legionellales bacterium]|nr:acyl-phosphate glycerol 3-phosphate acyltransferase [Legionellales bacterium]
MHIVLNTIFLIASYLMGSISSAIVVCKLWRLPDPRTTGSKNPGTTNVLRLGSKTAAFATLLGDSLKAVIPVLLAKAFGLSPVIQAFVVLLACLGHIFPIFLGFKGGKGVATGLGGILALAWPVGLMLIATWLVIALIFRYSSLAALISFILLPMFITLFSNQNYLMACSLLSLIIILMHRQNIKNLLTGQEGKIGAKKCTR